MGQIQILRDVPSLHEGTTRTVRIYLPDEYASEPSRLFPVLYLQDGQNVFDRSGGGAAVAWGADSALARLSRDPSVGPWIAVAVDHRGVERLADYSPWDDARLGAPARGARYAAFVARELVPRIERTLRARPERDARAIVGSSMGGLAALFVAWRYPEVFARVAALSPSVMWADGLLALHWNAPVEPPVKIYLDAGADEHFRAGPVELDYGRAAREFCAHLRARGYDDPAALRLVLEPGGQHSESDWRRRLPAALAWLLRRG